MVKDVKKLGSQLDIEPLGDLCCFHQREIPVIEPRAAEGVASHGAELPELRRHDCRYALGKATKRLELAERCMREATRVAVSRVRKVKEGNPPTGRRLDVRGIAEDIPAVAELAGEADIIPVREAVSKTPRGPALDSNNGVHLPALEQLAPALPRRKIIGQRKCQAMADVEVAVPALQSGPVAVLRLRGTIERSKVDGVRPGIAKYVSETVPGSLRNRNLQAMVDGGIAILHEVDEAQEREARPADTRTDGGRAIEGERPAKLFAAIVQGW